MLLVETFNANKDDQQLTAENGTLSLMGLRKNVLYSTLGIFKYMIYQVL